jgi:hypothetical protein
VCGLVGDENEDDERVVRLAVLPFKNLSADRDRDVLQRRASPKR